MLKRRIEQVRRRWWVVLVVAVLAVLAAALPSLNAHPTYVGRSALVLSSPGRTPEQDAMMAVGYSTIFNKPATIRPVESKEKIPDACRRWQHRRGELDPAVSGRRPTGRFAATQHALRAVVG